MDSLADYFKEQSELFKGNESFNTLIVTSWHAFDKYYKLIDRTAAYSAALLLHPNHRRSYLQASWHSSWVGPGVERAKGLWQQYRGEEPEEEVVKGLSHYERWQQRIRAKQRRTKHANDEFDKFINAPPDIIDVPVLDWWQEPSQQRSYPRLAPMALKVLSAVAMSAESERVFSGARRTIPWTRARLGGDLIEVLECLKHWQVSGLVEDNFSIDVIDNSDDEAMGFTESIE